MYPWMRVESSLALASACRVPRRRNPDAVLMAACGVFRSPDVPICPPDFRQWLQEQLGEKRVQKVEVSKRLVGSAATLVQSSYGMSPTMARYMRAQAVAFGEQDSTMTGSQQVRG